MDPLAAARAAKEKVKELVAAIPEVNGVGIARVGAAYAVRVNLARELDDPAVIPPSVDGVPVVCRVVGKLRARDD